MTAGEFAAHIYALGVRVHVDDERERRCYSTDFFALATGELRERTVRWWKYEHDEFTVTLDD